MHRAEELTAILVPTEAEGRSGTWSGPGGAAGRPQARPASGSPRPADAHTAAIWRGTYWTQAHEKWIAGQRFGEPALAPALAHYRAALDTRLAELDAVEDELAVLARPGLPLAAAVTRLGCYRGVGQLTGLTLAAEVGDCGGSPPRGTVHVLHRPGARRVFQRR